MEVFLSLGDVMVLVLPLQDLGQVSTITDSRGRFLGTYLDERGPSVLCIKLSSRKGLCHWLDRPTY